VEGTAIKKHSATVWACWEDNKLHHIINHQLKHYFFGLILQLNYKLASLESSSTKVKNA